jgi:alpha-glucosidase
VVESDEPAAVVIDPNSLPGFTAGTFDAALAAANGATANVAMEQYDPRSLLNLYRQLIQLHHENATVRNGAETVLDRDAEDALVWVRRAPASSRTSANVVAACNLSDKPVVVGDLGAVNVRGLRSLLSPEPKGDLLTVAPYAVFVGQVR